MTRFSVAAPALELLPAAKLDKALLQAIRSSDHHCLGYEEVQGNPALRKQLARLAFNWGGIVQADEVVVTAGCMEALVMSLKAVTRPGDTVAIESPTYFGIFQVLHSLGLQIVEIRSDPADGLDLDHLARVLQTQRVDACLFVPNFSNPGGSCMSDVRKKELVQLLALVEIPLIEDDIYGDLYFGKSRPRTLSLSTKRVWSCIAPLCPSHWRRATGSAGRFPDGSGQPWLTIK